MATTLEAVAKVTQGRLHLPLTAAKGKVPPDFTLMVVIEKLNGKYVAKPDRTRVPQGRHVNIVFVLENAPPDAELQQVVISEPNAPNGDSPNPFSFPVAKRVMLVNDDNTAAECQGRKFDYICYVKEGQTVIPVDPGIDNDPPA